MTELEKKIGEIKVNIINMINPSKIYPVLGFTVKNLIFEKGKQAVWRGCLLTGYSVFVDLSVC